MSKDHEVGHRKSPRKNQFPKGRSGNPKGRPRKESPVEDETTIPLYSAATRVFGRKIGTVTGGRKKKRPTLEVLVEQLAMDALSGDQQARSQVLKLAEKAGLATFEGGELIHRIIVEGGLPDDEPTLDDNDMSSLITWRPEDPIGDPQLPANNPPDGPETGTQQ
ncbi:DUF5681 domain-containing protein [Rhizorhabdus wittichii]|uniref:DUF5681 domain-containing protein n=1 Tax=Rhizorhabdus wittichii TaxID=160791 RepID=UPI0012FD5FF4|nr:DUF5681 domain-containing protein [Rhizorhabdus wittichii]